MARAPRHMTCGIHLVQSCPLAWAALPAGPHAGAARAVWRWLGDLQAPLTTLAEGTLEGGWEGGQELVPQLCAALRQAWQVGGRSMACTARPWAGALQLILALQVGVQS